jgi:putative hydrolase
LVLRPGDREHFDYLIGSIHRLPELTAAVPRQGILETEFMALLGRLVENGIDILAHPFRVFRRAGFVPPERLFAPTADLLRAHRVAVEINFHTNQPPVEFVRLCLDRGLRFSFGSDAHNLYEIGDFADHLKLLQDAGYSGYPVEVLALQAMQRIS